MRTQRRLPRGGQDRFLVVLLSTSCDSVSVGVQGDQQSQRRAFSKGKELEGESQEKQTRASSSRTTTGAILVGSRAGVQGLEPDSKSTGPKQRLPPRPASRISSLVPLDRRLNDRSTHPAEETQPSPRVAHLGLPVCLSTTSDPIQVLEELAEAKRSCVGQHEEKLSPGRSWKG